MKLIGTLPSPYVRKVRIVLAEKKIDYDFEIDSPSSANSKVALVNPLGKIPVLILDDGTPLFDSRVIVEYIDKASPNNKLLPTPNRERTEVNRWEALGDGLLDAATSVVYESRRPKKEQSATWIARQREKVVRTLAFMSEELGEQPFCMGTHFSLADIAVGTALGYLLFRFPELDWRSEHPNLARLHDKMMQRPSFVDTAPRD
ncbi:MAG: putative GST-like protein YibF [Betaproteobacteria bacterium ADurb.Bin341]|nr:MAG: putative GST-like protein YibF [Betaproteobacteria bacterium ADurb.Bin341]